MSFQPSCRDERGRPDVALQDESISWTWTEAVSVPGQRTDSSRMAFKDIQLFVGRHVPHLNVAAMRSDGHKITLNNFKVY